MDKQSELSDKTSRTKTSKTIDMRAERTRHRLQSALSQLLQHHKYEDITVDGIARFASVGRSTFYTHYADKDALKRDGIEQLRKQLLMRGRLATAKGGHSFTLAIFEHAREHLDHFRALAGGRGSSVALVAVEKTVQTLAKQELSKRHYRRHDLSIDIQVAFVSGSFMSVLVKWLESGAKEPPADIDSAYQAILQEGLGRSV